MMSLFFSTEPAPVVVSKSVRLEVPPSTFVVKSNDSLHPSRASSPHSGGPSPRRPVPRSGARLARPQAVRPLTATVVVPQLSVSAIGSSSSIFYTRTEGPVTNPMEALQDAIALRAEADTKPMRRPHAGSSTVTLPTRSVAPSTPRPVVGKKVAPRPLPMVLISEYEPCVCLCVCLCVCVSVCVCVCVCESVCVSAYVYVYAFVYAFILQCLICRKCTLAFTHRFALVLLMYIPYAIRHPKTVNASSDSHVTHKSMSIPDRSVVTPTAAGSTVSILSTSSKPSSHNVDSGESSDWSDTDTDPAPVPSASAAAKSSSISTTTRVPRAESHTSLSTMASSAPPSRPVTRVASMSQIAAATSIGRPRSRSLFNDRPDTPPMLPAMASPQNRSILGLMMSHTNSQRQSPGAFLFVLHICGGGACVCGRIVCGLSG
jgi:hypothetical protein